MTVERIHPKAPVMLTFIAIFTCLPSCINLSNIISGLTDSAQPLYSYRGALYLVLPIVLNPYIVIGELYIWSYR